MALYKQYMPVFDTQLPAVKIGGSFKYLRKIFNSNINVGEAKEALFSYKTSNENQNSDAGCISTYQFQFKIIAYNF